ncbi:uncharacterized protein LOC142320084 [Lycorma delicatula]|uniref:uncharacterized protein LOC142320084 n=1 Tax=Lycorma delicatula TaxID=130591 RepID=UPI003F51A8D6
MECEPEKENKGKLFVRRVQQVLMTDENLTAEELTYKVDEMKDLMITLAKMLKHTIDKVHKLDAENESLTTVNNSLTLLLKEVENNFQKAELSLGKYTSQCENYQNLKAQYEKLKMKFDEKIDQSLFQVTDSESAETIRSKRIIANINPEIITTKCDTGIQVTDGDSILDSKLKHSKYDWNIQKIQSFLSQKEQAWLQISGREREQRIKLSRLVKEMKVLRNQLEWKSNQLSFKEAEVMEKSKQLSDAERRITDLKKFIRKNKRFKKPSERYKNKFSQCSLSCNDVPTPVHTRFFFIFLPQTFDENEDYGYVTYSSAHHTVLKILDAVHHALLRLGTGAFRSSSVASLLTGEPSLWDRRD